MAGLCAAQELFGLGIDTIVLEARDRIGGRVYSVPFGDGVVDLGGSWIHGLGPGVGELKNYEGQFNPLYYLVNREGINVVKVWVRICFYMSQDGPLKAKRRYIMWNGEEADTETLDKLSDEVAEWYQNRSKEAGLNESVEDVFKSYKWSDDENKNIIVRSLIYARWSAEFAGDFSELSGRHFLDADQFNGSEYIYPKGSYQSAERLSKNLDIRFNQEVTEIDYQNDEIKFTTRSGNEYFARKAVVTVPLAILQQRVIKFKPELPEKKLASIDRLGKGLMDKLFLEF